LHDKEERPAKQETDGTAIGFAQENVLAAGARHHGG
jgi:hypothetical protein